MDRLIKRVRAAYHANGIPVDSRTETLLKRLTRPALQELAHYWEYRANERTQTVLDAIWPAGYVPPCGSLRGKAVAAAENRYHGDGYSS